MMVDRMVRKEKTGWGLVYKMGWIVRTVVPIVHDIGFTVECLPLIAGFISQLTYHSSLNHFLSHLSFQTR